jgi:hypothetical protein
MGHWAKSKGEFQSELLIYFGLLPTPPTPPPPHLGMEISVPKARPEEKYRKKTFKGKKILINDVTVQK